MIAKNKRVRRVESLKSIVTRSGENDGQEWPYARERKKGIVGYQVKHRNRRIVHVKLTDSTIMDSRIENMCRPLLWTVFPFTEMDLMAQKLFCKREKEYVITEKHTRPT